MQFSTVALVLAAAATASAGAVTSIITPTGAAPPGCTASYNGNFEISVVKPQGSTKRDLTKRAQCAGEGTLVINLENGIMKDAKGRQGYIASNYQFQFDGPPQAGAIYTAGFSVCGNNSVALGPTTVFYQCLSGGFYNLYNKNWAAQCSPVAIDVVPCDGGSGGSGSGGSGASGSAPAPSAAPPATTAAPAPVASQITDGQPQAPSAAVVSQITDGQPQAPSAAPPIATGAAAAFGIPAQVVMAAAGFAGAALL